MNQATIDRARTFALKHHGDQKYGDLPYSVHLEEVASIVKEMVASEDDEDATHAVVVAYLHDVVEDTPVTVEEIQKEFDGGTNHAVSTDVAAVTDEAGPNRKIRKRATYMKMRNLQGPYEWTPCLVKLADRLANVRSCVRSNNKRLLDMYRKEHEAFRLAVYRNYKNWKPYMKELDDLLD